MLLITLSIILFNIIICYSFPLEIGSIIKVNKINNGVVCSPTDWVSKYGY